MDNEIKKGRPTKAEIIKQAVEAGKGTPEELGALKYQEILDKINGNEVAQVVEAKCAHEFSTVRVVAHPNNYIANRCHKCGFESEVIGA